MVLLTHTLTYAVAYKQRATMLLLRRTAGGQVAPRGNGIDF